MTWIGSLLGKSADPVYPYTALVTYSDGSTGTLSFWALDLCDALRLAHYWMPSRSNVPAASITIRRRGVES